MCYCYVCNDLVALYVFQRHQKWCKGLCILLNLSLVLVGYRNVLEDNKLICFFGYEYGSINRAWYRDTQVIRSGPAWCDRVGECDGVAQGHCPSVAQDLWSSSLGWV